MILSASVPLGDFLGHAAPTLLQRWGLLLIVLAVLAFAQAWRLMNRSRVGRPARRHRGGGSG